MGADADSFVSKVVKAIMAWLATTDQRVTAESGVARYLEEIRWFPMLEPHEEFMLAKGWREPGDRDAAHKLVTSHLRLVAKIAMGYRGYGLPISEVVSEGNVGLMQAVKRFEPDKGFRLATYAMWWIKASIQEYILRSWSLVRMGTTATKKRLFFTLRKAKSKISALDEGDLHPDEVKLIAKRLGVTDQDVIDMNRRLGGDASLNAPIRDDGEAGEWQDWLVDTSPNQEAIMAEHEEFDHRRQALNGAIGVLNPRERRIFEARRLADEPMTLEDLAAEFGVSRERVRQIEVRAFEKVQSAVKGTIARQEQAALGAAHWIDIEADRDKARKPAWSAPPLSRSGNRPISRVHCATPIETPIGMSLPTQPSASSRHTSRMRRAMTAPSRSVLAGSTTQNSSPPVRASMSPGRSRVCVIRVKCCRQASPAA